MGKPLTIKPQTAMNLVQNGLGNVPPQQIDYYLHEGVIKIMLTAEGTKREPLVRRFWNELLSIEGREFYRKAMMFVPGSSLASFLTMVNSKTHLQKEAVAA